MMVLQVSLSFDPVKEKIKVRCYIDILIKKLITLGKSMEDTCDKVFRSDILQSF